eukprot:2180578-Rhodomonas_salina.7
MGLRDVRYCASVWCYLPTRPLCAVRYCVLLSGPELACVAICSRACHALPGTLLTYGAICLRACYAMPSTVVPSPYTLAMTDPASAGTRSSLASVTSGRSDAVRWRYSELRPLYAMPGTDVALRDSRY